MTEEVSAHPPLLSVVICVRNGAHLIRPQLRALANQVTDVSWELVIADNGSTDDTVAVIHAETADFPVAVRVVDAGARAGICHARNTGASAARGELLAYCDCDDLVVPGWVEAAAQGMAGHDVVVGELRERPPSMNEPPAAGDALPESSITSRFGGSVIGGNFGIHRQRYFAVGGFDESLPPYGCDDSEFTRRVLKGGLSIVRSDAMVIYYQPTIGFRTLLRKVYLSSQAEALVWHRHRDMHADRVKFKSILRGLVTAVPNALSGLRRGASKQATGRLLVTRVGNMVGYLRLVRGAGPPLLAHEPAETREMTVSSSPA